MGTTERLLDAQNLICDLQMNLKMSRDCSAELRAEVERLEAKVSRLTHDLNNERLASSYAKQLKAEVERLKSKCEERRDMLEDVVNELDLSDGMIDQHGPLGTAPATLVRLVLARKDQEIAMLKSGMTAVSQ